MNFSYVIGSLLLMMILFSCKEEINLKNPETKKEGTSPQNKIEIPPMDSDSIIGILQGKWKEIEYPYRLAQFTNSTVKFTEEGVLAEPTYREFKILQQCPFEVNNVKNARSQDLFLVMVLAGTCELVKVTNDTLTLSGFSVNTNSDYHIIYRKVE